ncbi:MAG: hypothetical protein CMD39_07320 [Gammaproteobacteria bacterium]|nr:hypothetical protein [Gammaproteobacteria bacterium]
MSTNSDRDEIVEWFHAQGRWVPVEDFIAAWKDRLTASQGRTDLRTLVNSGRLLQRKDGPRPGQGRQRFRSSYRTPSKAAARPAGDPDLRLFFELHSGKQPGRVG